MARDKPFSLVGTVELDESASSSVKPATAGLRRLPMIKLRPDDVVAQAREPIPIPQWEKLGWWAYRGRVIKVRVSASMGREELLLRIKHFVLTEDRQLERIRREVEAYENLDQADVARREMIPDQVRLFVWQRDQGRCVKCGCRERLEFDHIIPVIEGGSSTERNVQLLCEACNRKKGRTI